MTADRIETAEALDALSTLYDAEDGSREKDAAYEALARTIRAAVPAAGLRVTREHDREVAVQTLRDAARRVHELGRVSGSGVDVGYRASVWLEREADSLAEATS